MGQLLLCLIGKSTLLALSGALALCGYIMLDNPPPPNTATSFYPPNVAALKKGDFVFFSNSIFASGERKAEDFNYIQRFQICLTNGYENFTGNDLEELHAASCEVFLYLWFNGFYEKELAPKDKDRFPFITQAFREIYSRPEWVLNHANPIQGSGATYPAYFFDYNSAPFRKYFVDFIQRRLAETHYDGIFFDYIGSWALPEDVKALWSRKYPHITYDQAAIQFLKELREAIGQKRIFGNQAYRLSEDYYPYIDYDLSESHGTSFAWGKEAEIYLKGRGITKVRETFYRPWDGPNGYKQLSKPLREKAAKNPHVRVFDLNYLQPWYVPTGEQVQLNGKQIPVFIERTDRPAIFYGYALSKLVNIPSFASDWYAPGYGKDDIYFLDLGHPVDESFHEYAEVVVRYYEKGFVVITRKSGLIHFEPEAQYLPPGITGLWDIFEGTRVWTEARHHRITIYPAYYPATKSYYPSGRVYVYMTANRP